MTRVASATNSGARLARNHSWGFSKIPFLPTEDSYSYVTI